MLPVKFHPAAAAEADDAYDWYRQRDPRAAARFKAELSRLVNLASQLPELFQPHRLGTRRAVFARFPYLLLYVDRPDHVWVVAVAHGKRRPGYWHRRLR